LLYDFSKLKSPVRKVKKKRVKASREKPPQKKETELKDAKQEKYESLSLKDVGLDTGYSFSQTEGGQVALIETVTGSDQKKQDISNVNDNSSKQTSTPEESVTIVSLNVSMHNNEQY
jgi:hypothetical protein